MKKMVSIALALLITLSVAGITQAEDYRLGPGDVLNISVLGLDEMQVKDQVIRSDGKIAYPLAGEVNAGGLTPGELTNVITEAISHYLHDPKVTVNVTKFRTTRVYVLGEVVRPGLYEIEKQHSLLDAVGIAGGYTKDAAKKKVFIIRNGQTKPLEVNLNNLLTQGDMTQNYVLNDGDAVYLASNGRLDFARDILPFMTGAYYIRDYNKR